MHLIVVGLNHKTSPIHLREKLSISEERLPEALARLKSCGAISECLILSTCNRTEVYAYTMSRTNDQDISRIMGDFCKVSLDDFSEHTYSRAGHKAAEHIFRVTAGIDSMVLGEVQILGQVKEAYSTAGSQGATGTVLNPLFQQAITVGKRARNETEIGRGTFSVGSVAVQLARTIFDELDGRTMLVVGAGKMGELAVTHLIASGASKLLVANRAYDRAVALAAKYGGRPIEFGNLTSALQDADVVITSTGANEPVITRPMVLSALNARSGRPIFFIDIAVPRDIEPGVGDIDNAFVYNIDDLQAAVETDAATRSIEVAKVESIIEQEVTEFNRWFRSLDAVPVITALRDKLERTRAQEFDKLKAKLPHLSEEDLKTINSMTRSIVNKISHQPIICLKDFATCDESSYRLDTISEVFGLDPDEADTSRKNGTSLPRLEGRSHAKGGN